MEDGLHVLNREACNMCGACVEACYAGAIESVGRMMTVDEVMIPVLQDRPFYHDSGGGMTVSGGEPTLQADFTIALLDAAREQSIHTAVETCGFCDWHILDRLRTRCNLFLFDLKAEPASHAALTGIPFDRIGQNLRRLHDAGARIWIRLPVVPGINDTPARFMHAAETIRALPDVEAVEVLAYHAMGTEKIERMGLDIEPLIGISTPSNDQVQGWIRQLANLGISARTP